MPTSKFEDELSLLIRARFPLLYVQTFEEDRLLKILRNLCDSKGRTGLNRKLFIWSMNKGLIDKDEKVDASMRDPYTLFDHISSYNEPALFVLLDFHVYLTQAYPSPESYQIIRRIRDLLNSLRLSEHSKTVLFVSPVQSIPEVLQKDVLLLSMDLPNQMEIRLLLDRLITVNRGAGRVEVYLTEAEKELLCKSALGLTEREAEGAFSQAMVHDGRLDSSDIDYVLEQKQQILKKTGSLEYVRTDLRIEDVGGLTNLKRWLERRNKTWLDTARRYNLPAPKGVLLVGVPGCGKSLCAKAVASLWRLPLLRFDIGSVFGMYIGQSEANMQRALKTAEALSPCVLWVDEIEKGLGGMGGFEGDSGVSRRVFGYFLTWMQEKTTATFVFATANQIDKLPTELLRKGRFDEIFFVDLPTFEERKQIFKVHLEKRLTTPEAKGNFEITDEIITNLSKETEGFIGAEIEQVIISALYEAYFESRSISFEDIKSAIRKTVPLSVTQAEQVDAIRKWARNRAVPAS